MLVHACVFGVLRGFEFGDDEVDSGFEDGEVSLGKFMLVDEVLGQLGGVVVFVYFDF